MILKFEEFKKMNEEFENKTFSNEKISELLKNENLPFENVYEFRENFTEYEKLKKDFQERGIWEDFTKLINDKIDELYNKNLPIYPVDDYFTVYSDEFKFDIFDGISFECSFKCEREKDGYFYEVYYIEFNIDFDLKTFKKYIEDSDSPADYIFTYVRLFDENEDPFKLDDISYFQHYHWVK